MPTLSIWNGCSQGGRQGVTAAVRYPTDFDGIVVGAPAVNFVNLHAGRVALNRSVNATPAGVIPAVKYPLIHQAVLAACDAKDGVADEVLENPGACAFDPKVLQCSAHEDSTCLSAPQVESATKMYAGAKHPDTKALVLPGLAPGAELGWNVLGNTQPLSLAVDAFKYVFMKDRTWDASRFNAGVDIDVALASDPDGKGKPSAPVPAVLLVHGGPWARDGWGLNGQHQLFAWLSLISVMSADLYVRLCSMGVLTDLRLV